MTISTSFSAAGTNPTGTGPLTGQGALITGGSRGIGRAIARRLALDGAHVVFTYRTQADDAEALVAEIAEWGGHAHATKVDLAEPEQVAAAFTFAERAFQDEGTGMDIVVANAGEFTSGPLDRISVDEWDRVMAVNARGTFLTLQQAARQLRGGGRVITVSTIGTHWPSSGEALYAASKAAVEQLTRVASRELGPRGITANTLALGPTDTDLLQADVQPEALAGAAAMTALGRIGRPADIADATALLAHPQSRWITGQTIRADGGLT